MSLNPSHPLDTVPGTEPDVLDGLLGIQPGSTLHTVRHARDKVASATQGSQDLFFAPELPGNLSLTERLWVAYYAAHLTPHATLAAHYLAQLHAQGVDALSVASIDSGSLDELSDPRLRGILEFTRTLIESPVHGDQAALQALHNVGLSTEEIVVLAQLVAFMSYQVRLAAGLGALLSAGEA
ncbi:CMD domain protein [Pseudomonas sp. CFBP 13711]|uniref:CMD domain protein n=1 Tax=unclassified Pseudomonas TaxID=196821 RepID=UPI001786AF30|nr:MULTISPECIES: CMD domain protein [unclassified Pseudomonas]MBD8706521.1 CMD domain protein [Pseudomonas sp. CFBP 13711]MBD8712565.1 CMD domain protein [Pseudomonas sp. CFBP 13715]